MSRTTYPGNSSLQTATSAAPKSTDKNSGVRLKLTPLGSMEVSSHRRSHSSRTPSNRQRIGRINSNNSSINSSSIHRHSNHINSSSNNSSSSSLMDSRSMAPVGTKVISLLLQMLVGPRHLSRRLRLQHSKPLSINRVLQCLAQLAQLLQQRLRLQFRISPHRCSNYSQSWEVLISSSHSSRQQRRRRH